MEKLYDKYDRLHDYVRLSITDRCNLRCVYCMPKEGLPFFPTDRVLSQDEIVQMIQNFADMAFPRFELRAVNHCCERTSLKLSVELRPSMALMMFQLRLTVCFLLRKQLP